MNKETFHYDNKIVKWFAYATMLWSLVGMLVGLLAAFQLVFPVLNLDLAQTSFGRIRPVHTNAIIFAFVGNGIFMGVYYSLQRLCKARMFSDTLSKIHFWGWQAIIVAAASAIAAVRATTVTASAMPREKLRPRQPEVATNSWSACNRLNWVARK